LKLCKYFQRLRFKRAFSDHGTLLKPTSSKAFARCTCCHQAVLTSTSHTSPNSSINSRAYKRLPSSYASNGGPIFFTNTRNIWETDLVDIIWPLLENFVSILTDHPSWKQPRVGIVSPACSPEKENSESVLHSTPPYRRRELDFATFFNYFGI